MLQSGYTLEGGGQALLWLHGIQETPETARKSADALHALGLTVGVTDWLQGGRPWREWLRTAREDFAALRERHVCVSLCGQGAGIWPALMLAEEYTPEALFLLPACESVPNRGDRLALHLLKRRARIDLFAVSTRAHILLNKNAPHSLKRRARSLEHLLGTAKLTEFSGEIEAFMARSLLVSAPAAASAVLPPL